ncbi:hypothetical protein ALC57_06545 [Trachymyrmex cornetzi]|uniref:Uncharacterized protein n=1 Tax=Trachymyrmex cornetzi TaxID=471704 RepID=A0A151J8B1_9HYME|nr:hypothetical protein ALC57_06545 [Trachymyrmex cornetzi]
MYIDEDYPLLEESTMGSLFDLIYQTWTPHTLLIKNLKTMIGCIQTYMSNQRKIDPTTTRMREAKTMKNILIIFLELLKKKGLQNCTYSIEELNQFFSIVENKKLRQLFMEDILSMTTFFEWLRDLKEFIKNQPSTSTETIGTLFATTSKQKTDGIEQYITKLDNSRLHTVKTPEGEIGHQLIRLDVYDFNDIKNKDKPVLKNGNILTHYIFTRSMPWRFLTKSDKRHATWLMTNHHGLQWNDGIVPYRMARQLISEAVIGDTSSIIFLKGLEKREWLNDNINNDNVVIESIDTQYENIKSLENLDSNNTFRCGRHVKRCALQNVLKLFN